MNSFGLKGAQNMAESESVFLYETYYDIVGTANRGGHGGLGQHSIERILYIIILLLHI